MLPFEFSKMAAGPRPFPFPFHVHFSNPWHAFASHGLPAIAELLVRLLFSMPFTMNKIRDFIYLDVTWYIYHMVFP